MPSEREIEAAAHALCQSRKFETGHGGCAALCMSVLGSSRGGPHGCPHAVEVFGKLSRAALEDAEAAAWQPIETAPRDGAHVLGVGPLARGGSYIETIHWYQDRWTIVWMEGYGTPTHWRPLPAPPAGAK